MEKTIDRVSRAEIADGLRKAKSLIDRPDKWVQNAFQSADGRRICAFRALEKAANCRDDIFAINPLLYGMVTALLGESEVPDSDVCHLNNHSTHTELMAHFDRAIAANTVSGGQLP